MKRAYTQCRGTDIKFTEPLEIAKTADLPTGPMSASGQKHPFGRQPLTSGVPRSTDIPGEVGMSQRCQQQTSSPTHTVRIRLFGLVL
jgi:hypothetical protein